MLDKDNQLCACRIRGKYSFLFSTNRKITMHLVWFRLILFPKMTKLEFFRFVFLFGGPKVDSIQNDDPIPIQIQKKKKSDENMVLNVSTGCSAICRKKKETLSNIQNQFTQTAMNSTHEHLFEWLMTLTLFTLK